MRPVRNELLFALETLKKRHALLAKIGPATDCPELAREQLGSLELAMEQLQRPHLPVNPFI